MTNDIHQRSDEATEQCPYCRHPITHDELNAILSRIAEEEAAKFETQKKALLKAERSKHLAETSDLHKRLAMKEAEKKTIMEKAKAFGRQEAEAKLAKEQASLDKRAKALAAEKARMEASTKDQLDNQQEILEKDFEKKLLAQKAESEKLNHRFKKKVEDMQRQLEKKSNEELGDGAEVDVFNELKSAFPDDVITRVKKGTAGADIKHEIHIDGSKAGLILYDSKNRGQWRNGFVEKLREDQLAAKADYAILTTRRFAKDVREMDRQDGVIVVNPGRVIVVASIFRDFIEHLDQTKLSDGQKQAKRDKAYEFLTSQRCRTMFQRFEEHIAKLDVVEEDELRSQQKFRKVRGEHIRGIEKTVLGDLKREIHDILAGDFDA